MPKKKAIKKEEIAEDYCFRCKDGGSLRVCDYRNCLKTYHPECVERDDSLLETDERWFCGWHYCLICAKNAKFHCFCCPIAVCGRHLCDAEFALIKGQRGFCVSCLELALLIEDKKNVTSNGGKVDFNDKATYEFLFKGYWELVKVKEGITSKQLHSSDRLLKDGKNYDLQANCNYKEEDIIRDSEDDDVSYDDDWIDNQKQRGKKKKGEHSVTKRKGKSKEKEYVGWASKPLAEFLMSIDEDVTQELSQHEVATIVMEYCNKQQLFDKEKKKKVICDKRLQSLLGRKSVTKNGIYKLLTVHLSENLEQPADSIESEDDDNDKVYVPCKRQRKSSPDQKFEEKEIATIPREGCLAAIVSRNIKLVYLKRGLVLELANQLDTFHDKMIGSFVRVKLDSNNYFQKNSHMLVQVKGIKETSMKEKMNSTILLRVSNMLKEIPLCKLSDDDFTEEEIEDLNRRMRIHMLERPTVLQLEQKAKSLHEDITKYWIKKELVVLKSNIDRANEKGWRRELSEYMDRMQLLQTPVEQSRLIHEVPKVVAEVAEPEPAPENSPREYREEHKASSKQAPRLVSGIKKCRLENNVVSCCGNDGMDAAGVPIPEGNEQGVKKASISTTVNQNSQEVKPSFPLTSGPQLSPQEDENGDVASAGEKLTLPVDIGVPLQVENHRVEVIELSDNEIEDSRTSIPLHDGIKSVNRLGQHEHGDSASSLEKLPEPVDISVHVKLEAIELSDDDEIQDAGVTVSLQTSEDHDSAIWYCIGPHGKTTGPYSMEVLKKWINSSSISRELLLRYKVYKGGKKPAEAVLLADAIRQSFNS